MTPTTQSEADDDLETIAPAKVTLARATSEPAAEMRARRGKARVALRSPLAAIAMLLVLAVVVVLVLPSAVEYGSDDAAASSAPKSALETPTRSIITASEGNAVVPPFEALRVQRERWAAQEILERLLTLTETLAARSVERWGAPEMARARALAESGDAAFLAQEYEAAHAHYGQATAALEALAAQGDALATSRLEQGFKAIEAGDGARAAQLFEFVLAMDSNSEAARNGIARAAVTEAVLERVEEARAVAADGALATARGLVAQALELDADSTPARTFAADLDDRLQRADFLADISAGYAALRMRRFAEAEAAFARAEAQKPDAPELLEGRRILAAKRFAARIEALRAEAETAERSARWSEAAGAYGSALELDRTLAFARSGYERSRARTELDTALTAALARKEALNEPGELEAAHALLMRGRTVEEPDARLAEQLETLARTLRLAVIPVPVTLRSDGFTAVRVLRKTTPDRFVETTLRLRPGRYVATGTRVGYQDVRVEFVVTPEGTETPITVRCATRL